MKKIPFLSLIVFGAMSFACYAQPKLEIMGGDSFKIDTYNWGDVSPKQSPLKTDLIFKNIGKDTLQVPTVKPGCGCTVSNLSKKSLAPNDTAKLHIDLNIGASQGQVNKSITITTNEPNPTRYIFLKANVIIPLAITPNPYFTFTQFKVGQETNSTLQFKNNTKNPITIKDIACSPSSLRIDLKQGTVIAPNQEIRVTAFATADKAGNYSGRIDIKTDNPDCDKTMQAYGTAEESPIFAPKSN